MKIVVDTNIVFSAILNTNSKIGDLLMNSDQIFDFETVTYLLEEIDNHQGKLLEISGLTAEQLKESKFQILSHIKFISEEQIPFKIWHKAAQIVRDVDMDDIAFVALSEYEDVKLWTVEEGLNCERISKVYFYAGFIRPEKKIGRKRFEVRKIKTRTPNKASTQASAFASACVDANRSRQ